MNTNDLAILISDDSALARKQLKDILQKLGCEKFLFAKDGIETIKLYKENKPNIVFLDIIMPECDGIQATKEIIEFDPTAKIIIVSSVGTQSQLKQAILSGAKDFIQKPLHDEQVTALIAAHLGGN